MNKTTEGEITVDLIEAQAVVPAPMNGASAMVPVPGNPMLAMIDRAARDPSVDIVKLEQLLKMAADQRASEARQAWYAAFAKMQPELPIVQEKGSINIGSGKGQSFARWEDINRAIKPVLARHGFALSFRTALDENKMLQITGILMHEAGHAEETTFPLPLDNSGSKNAVQAYGSSSSYGRRYVAIALLNLASTADEDTDGYDLGGSDTDPISDVQREQLQELINRSSADIQKFCTYMGVGALAEIKRKEFPRAVEALNLKMGKK